MAYVGQTSIRSVEHMEHAIDYVANPEKALGFFHVLKSNVPYVAQMDERTNADDLAAEMEAAIAENEMVALPSAKDISQEEFEMGWMLFATLYSRRKRGYTRQNAQRPFQKKFRPRWYNKIPTQWNF